MQGHSAGRGKRREDASSMAKTPGRAGTTCWTEKRSKTRQGELAAATTGRGVHKGDGSGAAQRRLRARCLELGRGGPAGRCSAERAIGDKQSAQGLGAAARAIGSARARGTEEEGRSEARRAGRSRKRRNPSWTSAQPWG
jgi:hypothetical protein